MSQLTGKDPDAGKDWRQEEEEAAEDELVREQYWLNGHEFEQTPGDGGRQGSLAHCGPRGHKEIGLSGWKQPQRTGPHTLHLKILSATPKTQAAE